MTMGLVERLGTLAAAGIVFLEVMRLSAGVTVHRHGATEQISNAVEPTLNTAKPTSFASCFSSLGRCWWLLLHAPGAGLAGQSWPAGGVMIRQGNEI